MGNYSLSSEAKRDIRGIRQYTIEKWGNDQAERYISDLRNQMRMLGNTPTLGRHCPELIEGLYCFPHKSHVIYYMIVDNGISVADILHKRMVPELHLKGL